MARKQVEKARQEPDVPKEEAKEEGKVNFGPICLTFQCLTGR